MDDEKVIDQRYIEQLRSLPKSNHDDKQDAMAQEMREAADFARRNGGELGIFKSEIKYIDELNPQPVLDGPLPRFCIAHHCTERGPKCDKCAYTAMGPWRK